MFLMDLGEPAMLMNEELDVVVPKLNNQTNQCDKMKVVTFFIHQVFTVSSVVINTPVVFINGTIGLTPLRRVYSLRIRIHETLLTTLICMRIHGQ